MLFMNIANDFSDRVITLPDGRAGLRGTLQVEVREADAHAAPVLEFISSDETLDRYGEIIVAWERRRVSPEICRAGTIGGFGGGDSGESERAGAGIESRRGGEERFARAARATAGNAGRSKGSTEHEHPKGWTPNGRGEGGGRV